MFTLRRILLCVLPWFAFLEHRPRTHNGLSLM